MISLVNTASKPRQVCKEIFQLSFHTILYILVANWSMAFITYLTVQDTPVNFNHPIGCCPPTKFEIEVLIVVHGILISISWEDLSNFWHDWFNISNLFSFSFLNASARWNLNIECYNKLLITELVKFKRMHLCETGTRKYHRDVIFLIRSLSIWRTKHGHKHLMTKMNNNFGIRLSILLENSDEVLNVLWHQIYPQPRTSKRLGKKWVFLMSKQ